VYLNIEIASYIETENKQSKEINKLHETLKKQSGELSNLKNKKESLEKERESNMELIITME